jgi:phosphatidylserine decarboxylase
VVLIARDGFPFIGVSLALTGAFWTAGHYYHPAFFYGMLPGAVLSAFMVYFFRDPDRTPPTGDGLIISAADGRIVGIEEIDNAEYEEYLGSKIIQLSIFLSPLDVHINRIPISGQVDFVKWHRGRFLAAFVAAASTENEQSIIGISHPSGRLIVKQIVGVLARRIVCHLKAGDTVQTGDRFGLMRFGSRVDYILPAATQIRVKPNDKVRSGETIIGVVHDV